MWSRQKETKSLKRNNSNAFKYVGKKRKTARKVDWLMEERKKRILRRIERLQRHVRNLLQRIPGKSLSYNHSFSYSHSKLKWH